MVLDQFKARFQGEEVEIPLALRQESPDITFSALLEDDAPVHHLPMPVVGHEPDSGALPAGVGGGEDPLATVESLLGLPSGGLAPEGAAPTPGPAPGPAPAPEGEPTDAMPDLDELMGMM